MTLWLFWLSVIMRIKVEKAAFAQQHFERFRDNKDKAMKYEKLFTPGYIGGLRIKNRVVMTAMGNGLAAENGECTLQMTLRQNAVVRFTLSARNQQGDYGYDYTWYQQHS